MANNKEHLYSRTGAAREAGCSESTLINYERRRLVKPQRLDRGRGYPVYRPADIERARQVFAQRPNRLGASRSERRVR